MATTRIGTHATMVGFYSDSSGEGSKSEGAEKTVVRAVTGSDARMVVRRIGGRISNQMRRRNKMGPTAQENKRLMEENWNNEGRERKSWPLHVLRHHGGVGKALEGTLMCNQLSYYYNR